MKDEALEETVRRALSEGPFAMRQLAAESGLSYDVLRSWRSGRRRPNQESVRKLANGLSSRAERLKQLAADLRQAQAQQQGQATQPAQSQESPTQTQQASQSQQPSHPQQESEQAWSQPQQPSQPRQPWSEPAQVPPPRTDGDEFGV